MYPERFYKKYSPKEYVAIANNFLSIFFNTANMSTRFSYNIEGKTLELQANIEGNNSTNVE